MKMAILVISRKYITSGLSLITLLYNEKGKQSCNSLFIYLYLNSTARKHMMYKKNSKQVCVTSYE
jgi:hypothetical protein